MASEGAVEAEEGERERRREVISSEEGEAEDVRGRGRARRIRRAPALDGASQNEWA